MREIIVDVSEDGEVKIETRGFTGKACVTESEFLRSVLGTETHRQLTPAYYQQEEQQHEAVKRYLPLCG